MSVATILLSVGVQFANQGLGAGSITTTSILVGVADPINVSMANLAGQVSVSSATLNAAIQAAVRSAGCSVT